MNCNDCLHFTVCEALEQGNGIKKVHPIQCGCFKDKADVVEVVRCKDCKHCEHINDEFAKDWWQCKRRGNSFQRKPDDFCSYGVLKESEDKQ